MAVLEEYTWTFVLALIFAIGTAIGIGANDLANSFATSVGSRALTMGQVVILASICEFGGAVLLGAGVTSTIKSGVARLAAFSNTPVLLMYGFMCVSLTSSIIDNAASQIGAPISMTHTTVGATVGMALALRGASAVIWSESKDEFPYLGGVAPILMSWVISPLMCAIITFIVFGVLRTFVLRSPHSFQRAFFVLPVLVGGIFWLITSFIIQTGSKNGTWEEYEDSFAVWVGAVVGISMGLFTLLVVMPILRRRINHNEEELTRVDMENAQMANESKLTARTPADASEAGENKAGTPGMEEVGASKNTSSWKDRIRRGLRNNFITHHLFYNINQDIHTIAEQDARVVSVHQNAEVFDRRTESLFRYLQIFSAGVMSFTHGANDVSNAMAPFSAVYTIWNTGSIGRNVGVDTWILVIGGAGISIGLFLFSRKVIQTLGVKAVRLTNTRGFSAELATAITVAVASRYGIPISTTQTITGGLFAVGIMEGARGVNWRVFGKVAAGWVFALCLACAVSVAFVAFGVNTPERRAVDAIEYATTAFNATGRAALNQISAAAAGADGTIVGNVAELRGTLASVVREPSVTTGLRALTDVTQDIWGLFNTTLAYNPYTQAPGTLAP